MAYWKEEFMLKQRFGFGFIYLAQITQCPEIVWARKKMPPPQTGRHPIDLSSVWVTNGINEIVWDKLCFKAAVHGGQKAVKMFTGFDTSSYQGRSGHTGTPHGVDWRCPGHWASLGRDYSALSHHSGSRAWGVCWQPSPPCTLLLARKLMSKYFRFQAVPSPLPTPATRTRTLPGTNEPPWQQLGWEQGKAEPTKKDQVKEDWSTAGSHPARGVGHQHWAASSPKQLSPQLRGKMSISSEHKPLGKQVTGSLHMVSKVCAQGHNSLMWDQSTSAGLHLSGVFSPIC